jgi:MFS transporter, Spinster family, sphingosine-1-phosphate transporter
MAMRARSVVEVEAIPPDSVARPRVASLLFLGTLTSAINILDRSALNILAQPVKVDLGLSDTELGLLTGLAFALFYSAIGLPIARYVDRPTTDRPKVIATCIAIWSAMTVICGLVTSYAQLLTARMLVGVGESGSGPAFFTLIHDRVPRAVQARAFGIYALGAPLGVLFGLAVGGFLAQRVGWRMTFVIVGAPGLLLALWIKLGLGEPRKERRGMAPRELVVHPSLWQTMRLFARSPALLWLAAAAATGGMYLLGQPSWAAVYLIRVLQLQPAQAGLLLGLSLGLPGLAGAFLGGVLADRVGRSDPGRALLVPSMGLLVGIPASLFAFHSPHWIGFAAAFWISALGAALYMGPLLALLQIAVPRNCRATASVIVFMLLNLVGGGLGPLLIGIASDFLSARHVDNALRWVMMICSLGAIVPALLYLRAGQLMRHQIELTEREAL